MPAALAANALLAILLVVVQWPAIDAIRAMVWLISMAATLAMRGGLYLLHRRYADAAGGSASRRLKLFRIGALATGSVWGSAGVAFFPPGDIVPQVFLAFVLAGVSAGAITSLAVDRLSILGFVAPALIPLAVAFLIEGEAMPVTMGLMVALFLLFVVASAVRTQRYLFENTRLRAKALEREADLRHQQQLTEVIARAQSRFIRETDRSESLEGLLTDILALTGSASGLVGEVLRTASGEPYIKNHALTNLAWDDRTPPFCAADGPQGLELHTLDRLICAALTSGEPVLVNAPSRDSRRGASPDAHPPLDAFLGIPVHHDGRLVALVGVANRPGGYDRAWIDFLHPLLITLGQLVDAARNQAQHRETERRLAAVINGTQIGTWEWNVQTGEAVFNERWAEIAGYALAELQPISIQTWLDLFHPEDRKRSSEVLRQHSAGELDGFDFQSRVRHKDGHWVWVHDRGHVSSWTGHGKPLLTSGIRSDITERMEAGMALQRSEARLRGLFELSPIGIALNDYATGAFVEVNDALLMPTGYTREELLELTNMDITPQEYAAQEARQRESLDRTGRFGPYEKEYIRKDGGRYPVLLNGMVLDAGADRKMIWSIVEDITERKRLDRMKDEFVATVSHELRTPLTAIAGALGLIDGGALGELPARAREMIAIAHKNSQRLSHLIDDLLDMERLRVGEMRFDMQAQPLMPLILRALETHQTYGAERGVALTLTRRVPEAEVRVDRERLMQVLSNLLSNAIKYSPERTPVEVAVERREGWVRVTVTDHGRGIPLAFRERIFQRFTQADASDSRQKGGTGLGLAITKELVERMGGRLGFESVEGRGASFYFELPIEGPPLGPSATDLDKSGQSAPSRCAVAP